ncbi:hypothetical protein GCM10008937_07590 [Deinococcus depolymerans]|uniref:Uncharacterized protein n=1 Tax=Deinococcus depolymerans TaxID=392408 RepID=A0ABN1BQB3_9DEIO
MTTPHRPSFEGAGAAGGADTVMGTSRGERGKQGRGAAGLECHAAYGAAAPLPLDIPPSNCLFSLEVLHHGKR